MIHKKGKEKSEYTSCGKREERDKGKKNSEKKDHTWKRKDSLTEVSFAVDTSAKKGISLPGKKEDIWQFCMGKEGEGCEGLF